MARNMVEEDTDWLDGMIHEAVTEDNSLPNKCFDIAKGGCNSALCVLSWAPVSLIVWSLRLCMLCSSGFMNLQSAVKIE
jgi:hypothetical protein